MNAIAWLGRLVIERVRGIGVATLMLLQIIFSLPTWLGVKLFIYQMYRVGVMSLLIITVSGLFIG
ncbi:MAG TPA: ABC transporter permease, partial [Acinetobacter radioresistens]|nr:ABC transporter permease [Acinetobacter radioresistens]